MDALFTSVPLVGHLNPLLRQAEELQRRGWHAVVASTSEMRAHVGRESRVPFLDLGSIGPVADRLQRNEESASRDPNFVRGASRIVDGLAEVWPLMFDALATAVRADPPDVIVVDLFSSAGMCVAEAQHIPFVVNNANLLASLPLELLPPADHLPLLFSGRSRREVGLGQRLAAPILRALTRVVTAATVGRTLNDLRRSRGLPPIAVHQLLRDRTILVDGAFGLEYERPLPPHIHMVGPMLPPSPPALPMELADWLANGPPVVYVNLGTMSVAPNEQLRKMAEGLASDAFRALWILKPLQAARLPQPLPLNLRVLEWGPPPISVLAHPNVRAFVSHCGINSVHESIDAGTPIVGIPMFADQLDMAIRVVDAGAGVRLDKIRFTAAELRAGIERVLHDPSFAASLPPLQAAFARAGGVSRAADLIASSLDNSRRDD